MTYEEIETFLQIYESGNIGKAANLLNITQSTASIRIKQLEQELDVQLLYRQQGIKNVTLTSVGELFLPIAQMWYALWHDANNLKNIEVVQNLKIASSDTINVSTLYNVYDKIISHYNYIDLSVRSYHSKEIHRLIDNQICDIGFCTNIYHFNNIISTPLYDEEILLVIHKNHPYFKSRKTTDLSFGTEIYVEYSKQFNLWHENFSKNFNHKIFTVGTVSMQTSYLTESSRWSFTPANTASLFCQIHQDFIAIKVDLDIPKRTIYLLQNKYTKLGVKNAISLFLNVLYEELKSNETIYLK